MPTDTDRFRLDELAEDQLHELERLLSADATGSADATTDSGSAELVAYYVPSGAKALPAAELRAHLAGLVPASHVPVHYVPVAALPRLANGKLDRRALAAAGSGLPTVAPAPAVPPSDDLQRWLAGVWAAVLDTPVPSVQGDFFVLGGSSLRAVQVLGRIAAVLGVELGMTTLFGHPTLAAFAAEVRHRAGDLPDFDEIVALAAEVYAEDSAAEGQADA